MPRPPQRSRGRRESRILRGPPQCGGRGDESCDRRSGLRSSPRSRGLTHGYCAAALRVTHRPSLRSSSRYGPCGPAWTGRPGRPRRPTGRGRPPDSGWRAGREPVGVGVRRRRQAGVLGSAWSAWCRVRGDFGKAMAAHQGRGGGRAARPRPTPTPTFGPGARRVPRRAPVQGEPPGGRFPAVGAACSRFVRDSGYDHSEDGG